MSGERVLVATTVNGTRHERAVEPRMLLSDFIRHELGLTGTHVGCEHGVCGACTILLDELPVRACLMFAAQANGRAIETVEGLALGPTKLDPLQEAFREAHGLQCGYCTPGILMTMKAFLAEHPSPSEAEVREALSGNLCRCTGYQHIVDAVLLAARQRILPSRTGGVARSAGVGDAFSATPPTTPPTTPPAAPAPLLGEEGKVRP